jgi:hypothetical protein
VPWKTVNIVLAVHCTHNALILISSYREFFMTLLPHFVFETPHKSLTYLDTSQFCQLWFQGLDSGLAGTKNLLQADS